jgi:hypothetical protein
VTLLGFLGHWEMRLGRGDWMERLGRPGFLVLTINSAAQRRKATSTNCSAVRRRWIARLRTAAGGQTRLQDLASLHAPLSLSVTAGTSARDDFDREQALHSIFGEFGRKLDTGGRLESVMTERIQIIAFTRGETAASKKEVTQI